MDTRGCMFRAVWLCARAETFPRRRVHILYLADKAADWYERASRKNSFIILGCNIHFNKAA